MRIDSLTAIDVHVHIESDGHGCFSLDDELMAASAKYFKTEEDRAPVLERVADIYRSLNMAAVVFTIDSATFTGHPALSSEDLCDQAREHADVLIPFGSVDPLRGADAVAQARRLVTEHGARGLSSTRRCRGSRRTTSGSTRCGRRSSPWASRRSSTPGRPASARGCPAAGGSSCGCRTRCSSTTWRPTSRG